MISPTVGRMVHFTPAANDKITRNGDQKLAAIIACVWSDTCVNLAVIDANGTMTNRTSVPLIQEGEPKPDGYYCEWMEYQKGQAAKTEELEHQLQVRTADSFKTIAAKDINQHIPEGRLLIAAVFVLRSQGPVETKDKTPDEILDTLGTLADALSNTRL